ncbi:hypothetical protein [Achromobacter ruhlandii]|uniref:hypothetical protein n=1 Tax=Achromobacter ruhlandii TaxID=72557 RepID=UPI0015815C91|nr:hypothetical protein [Achromobacter ruhlandii]
MLDHLLHSHLEFRLIVVGLGLAIAILAFYVFVCWREGRRTSTPKFSAELRRRLQPTKRGSKKRPSGKEPPP